MENNDKDKFTIKNFRLEKYIINGTPHGIRTVFPYPIALGATFNTNLISEAGRVISSEISAKATNNINNLCLITPSFAGGNGEENYSSEDLLAFECAKAFTKGIEKSEETGKNCNCAAFPQSVIVSQTDLKIVFDWLKHRYSKGIALNYYSDEFVADFARFSGVIYSNCNPPLMLGEGEDQMAAIKKRAENAIKHGITAGGVYGGAGIDALSPEYAAVCAKKINDLKDSINYTEKNLPAVKNIHTDKNVRTALRTAEESIVLLKNDENLLPFSPSIKNVAVIGDGANSLSSFGCDGETGTETLLNALKCKFMKAVNFTYSRCKMNENGIDQTEKTEAFALAKSADATILFVSDSEANAFFSSSRQAYADFVKDLFGYSNKTIIIFAGTPKDLTIFKDADAILVCWKSGECGAAAVTNVINGLSPSGKLPLAVIKNNDEEREYYPFGFGLTYSVAEIFGARKIGGKCEIYVANRHFIPIREVVQIYRKTQDGYKLAAFKKFSLASVERKIVTLQLNNDIDCTDELYAAFYMPTDGSGKKIKIENQ